MNMNNKPEPAELFISAKNLNMSWTLFPEYRLL